MEKVFKNLKLCITGVNSHEEKKIVDSIEILGGQLSKALDQSVNCLLVKRVGSQKHQFAITQKIPCVELKWIVDCLKMKQKIPYDSYRVATFTGLQFHMTNLLPDEKYFLERLIKENGGQVAVNLIADGSVTHLVPGICQGKKYDYAVQHHIKIVSRTWIEQCCKNKTWCPESFIAPPPQEETIDDLKAEKECGQGNQMCEEKIRKMTRIKSMDENDSQRTMTSVMPDLDLSEATDSLIELPILFGSSAATTTATTTATLQDEVFFIDGFPQKIKDYLIGLVVLNGARRHHYLSIEVTKILLGEYATENLLLAASKHPCGADCITLAWLLRVLDVPAPAALNQYLGKPSSVSPTQTNINMTTVSEPSKGAYTANEDVDVDEDVNVNVDAVHRKLEDSKKIVATCQESQLQDSFFQELVLPHRQKKIRESSRRFTDLASSSALAAVNSTSLLYSSSTASGRNLFQESRNRQHQDRLQQQQLQQQLPVATLGITARFRASKMKPIMPNSVESAPLGDEGNNIIGGKFGSSSQSTDMIGDFCPGQNNSNNNNHAGVDNTICIGARQPSVHEDDFMVPEAPMKKPRFAKPIRHSYPLDNRQHESRRSGGVITNNPFSIVQQQHNINGNRGVNPSTGAPALSTLEMESQVVVFE